MAAQETSTAGHISDEEMSRLLLARQKEEAAEERRLDFEEGVRRENERFFNAVSEAKPYADYISLLGLNALVGALLAAGVHGLMWDGHWPERSVAILMFAVYLTIKLLPHIHTTHEAVAAKSLIYLAYTFGLPFPFHPTRSAAVRVIFSVYIATFVFLMASITGYIGYRIAESAITAIEGKSSAGSDQTTAPTIPVLKPTDQLPPLP